MLRIYIDAAYRQKTHEAGLGIVFKSEDWHKEYKYFIPNVIDNHEAEFLSMLRVFLICNENKVESKLLLIHTDSQILVDAYQKRYASNKFYAVWLSEIINLTNEYEVILQQIPRKLNRHADVIARQALNKQGIYETWHLNH